MKPESNIQTSSDDTQKVCTAPDSTGKKTKELIRITPSIKPEIIRLVLILVVGVIIIIGLFTNPELFGSPEATNIVLIIVQILVAIAVIRVGIEILILHNMAYIFTTNRVRREYSLLARTKSQEVPYDLIRSTELSQSRIEYLLGVGTIVLNQGLGDLELSRLPNYTEANEIIQRQINEVHSSNSER